MNMTVTKTEAQIKEWDYLGLWACCTLLSITIIALYSIPALQIVPMKFGVLLSFCAMIPLVTALITALAAKKCGFALVNLLIFYACLAKFISY